jgi:competence ComEA-like helix-hairpin-helix protein
MIPKFISDYFLLTNKERKGLLVILGIILMLIFLPALFPFFIKEELPDRERFEKKLAEIQMARSDSSEERNHSEDDLANDYSINPTSKKISYLNFYFDPNTATAAEWTRLGIKPKTIRTIENYRNKGGKFYQATDLKKIFGFSPKDAERLIPFVVIRDSESKKTPNKTITEPPASFERKKKFDLVDINTADTNQFKTLPGIGSKLSQRIINFRNKLGGFYSIEQISEVYLLPDSVFRKIQPMLLLNESEVRKLNINAASLDELKAHPYINDNLAKALIAYREQHGSFGSAENIKMIMLVSEEIFQKLIPYLSVK